MVRKFFYFILLLFLIADIGYSFVQHYNKPLDGDMAGGIVPAQDIKPILNSPFGTDVLTKKLTYPNPNRFFSHWTFYKYFNIVPFFLQKFVEPIDSIYLSCAISKIIIQAVLIILLAMAISGTKNILKMDFAISAVLVTPFFQTNGYRTYMGIIDSSTTYTFFYALPCALLLIYLLPFIRQFYYEQRPYAKLFINVFWIPLAIVVCLSGPLNPGVVLIFSVLVLGMNIKNNFFKTNQKGFFKKGVEAIALVPKSYWFYLIPVSIFSIYSLYIGSFNSVTIKYHIPLGELYSRLPKGVYYQFTQKIGFPILFLILTINTIIINYKYKTPEGEKIMKLFKWVGIFSLIYIVLLPLGGYRVCRPYVLRFDTILPITLCLVFMFGISTLFLFKSMTKKDKIWYIPIIVGVLFIFTNSDRIQFDENKCERLSLKEISESKEAIVVLQNDCKVLSWDKISKPEDSDLGAQLLYIWGITKEKRLYYNK